MKFLAGNKVLCALLAAVAAGMGAQTYYLLQIHRQLSADEVRAAEFPARVETDDDAVDGDPLDPQQPGPAWTGPDPFAELEEIEARMRSLFDDFNERFDRGFGQSWFDDHPFFSDGTFASMHPCVDLRDRGDHYEMTVDIPGAREADVLVKVEDETLIVEGSRSTAVEHSEPGTYVRRERQLARFERRLRLPGDADPDTLESSYDNGVLTITFGKRA